MEICMEIYPGEKRVSCKVCRSAFSDISDMESNIQIDTVQNHSAFFKFNNFLHGTWRWIANMLSINTNQNLKTVNGSSNNNPR